jgi:hypothetical protein
MMPELTFRNLGQKTCKLLQIAIALSPFRSLLVYGLKTTENRCGSLKWKSNHRSIVRISQNIVMSSPLPPMFPNLSPSCEQREFTSGAFGVGEETAKVTVAKNLEGLLNLLRSLPLASAAFLGALGRETRGCENDGVTDIVFLPTTPALRHIYF